MFSDIVNDVINWLSIHFWVALDYFFMITIMIAIRYLVKYAFVKPSLHDWVNISAFTISTAYLIFEIIYNWDYFNDCSMPI